MLGLKEAVAVEITENWLKSIEKHVQSGDFVNVTPEQEHSIKILTETITVLIMAPEKLGRELTEIIPILDADILNNKLNILAQTIDVHTRALDKIGSIDKSLLNRIFELERMFKELCDIYNASGIEGSPMITPNEVLNLIKQVGELLGGFRVM